MSTNKDKIIQFIKDETSKCIQNNSYTFENVMHSSYPWSFS